MIQEQNVTMLPALHDAFPGAQLALVRAAIAAGNTAGRLWRVVHDEGGESALLWDKGNNVFYLGGEGLPRAGLAALANLVANEVQPQATAEGARYFRARGVTAELDAQIPSLFPALALQQTEKRFCAYPAQEPPVTGDLAIEGLSLLALDGEFLQSDRENLAEVQAEIAWMWPGAREAALSRFLANGFGSAAVVGQRIVCWCTAEYVSAERCGTGIETEADYRRQGIATATAAHFVAAALQRGLTPYWECDSENLPSVRIATRLGFQEEEAATLWVGLFPPPGSG